MSVMISFYPLISVVFNTTDTDLHVLNLTMYTIIASQKQLVKLTKFIQISSAHFNTFDSNHIVVTYLKLDAL